MSAAGAAEQALAALPERAVLVLYDGVCAMCNGIVTFLVARDRDDRFRFLALQSELGRQVVSARGGDPDEVSTLYVITAPARPGERVLVRGRAGIRAMTSAGGPWVLLHALRILPTFLLDAGYRFIANRRYRLAGRLDACPVPPPEHRHKFL
ncbi:MAG TPA: DCC1-like thiol-disulfide oxidoreductase family protein [Kofleriaceae bacterium]|nr:DCC1-like thiol-disulfide oxidoreductase family protein [Kofleriaceae bacterium]